MIVDQKNAEYIAKKMWDICKDIESSRSYVYANCSEEEWSVYAKISGKIMGFIIVDILNDIFYQFPDLRPDEYHLPER